MSLRPALTLPASSRSAPAATCSATSSRRPCRSSGRGASAACTRPARLPPGVAVPAAGSAKTDAGTGPTEGVDYSGTNVQEQGVDEPDSVKTNGKTLFAVAGNRLNAVDVTSAQPEAARLAEARQRLEPRAPARRRPPARALARRLLADAAARPTALAMPYYPAHVSHLRDRRLEPEGAAGRPHADARRRATSTRASSARSARIVVSVAGADEAAVRARRPSRRTPRLRPRRDQNRAVVQSSRVGSLAPDLHDQARGPRG